MTDAQNDIWLGACLCGVMMVLAIHAKEELRLNALICAAILSADWALYVSAWSDYSPATLTYSLGIPLGARDLWAICDALACAGIAALAIDEWWSDTLQALLVGQLACHALSLFGYIHFDTYSGYLNGLFLLQIGVFAVIGGGGLICYVGNILSASRDRVILGVRALSSQEIH